MHFQRISFFKQHLIILVTSICLLVFSSCDQGRSKSGAQEHFIQDTYISGVNTFYSRATKKPVSGIIKANYPTGELANEFQCVDGKMHGYLRRYYNSGKLLEEQQYTNGEVTGKAIRYRESGDIEFEFTYLKNKPVTFKSYYKTGKLFKERSYQAGMPYHEKKYFDTGKLMKEIVHTNIKPNRPVSGTAMISAEEVEYTISGLSQDDGVIKEYFETGEIRSEYYFEDNALILGYEYNREGKKVKISEQKLKDIQEKIL